MRFIPFLLVLSTKNVHKFCPFLMPSKFSHMSSCSMFLLLLLSGSAWPFYNPCCSYPMTSILISCAIEECIWNFLFSSSSSFSWMQAGSVRLARGCSFFFLFSVYSNLRVSISYNLLKSACFLFVCFVCSSIPPNSERCFAVLRANTNYNFLIYGNDFTQIQEIRSHCRHRRLF